MDWIPPDIISSTEQYLKWAEITCEGLSPDLGISRRFMLSIQGPTFTEHQPVFARLLYASKVTF
jgi:hypothetical protein